MNGQTVTRGAACQRRSPFNESVQSRPGTRLLTGAFVAGLLVVFGCGTTRITDTRRTATEQLLISEAIDRAIDEIDGSPLAGKKVHFVDGTPRPTEDQMYLSSTVRQKLLASGAVLASGKGDAELLVEARTGALGTDSYNVMFGIPSVNVPPARRIDVVTVQRGDTATSLGQLNKFPAYQVERFRVLNALGQNSTLQAGDREKLVR